MFFKFEEKSNHENISSMIVAFQPRQRVTRAHSRQVLCHTASDGTFGCQSRSLYFRAVRLWNSLPVNVAEAETIISFKNALDKHWEHEDFLYNPDASAPGYTSTQPELEEEQMRERLDS